MTAVYALSVVLSFVIFFVALPRIIFPLHLVEGTFLDRTVAGGVWMTALTCAAMYILGTFGALESLGLGAAFIACWWFVRGRHGERGRLSRMGERFFSFADRREIHGNRAAVVGTGVETTGRLRGHLSRVVASARKRYTGPVDLIIGVLVVIVLIVAAYIRFERALSHIELVPQDSFLALFWTKSITSGTLLKDGTYPQGAYMWMSLINRAYPFGAYQLTRFAGPLMNAIELGILYWATSRISRSRAAGLMALAAFGLFAGHPQFQVVWPRQIGAMTQEFALGFGLASVVFGAQYMASKRNVDLYLAVTALFVAVTSNTLVLPFMIFAYASIVLIGVVTGSLWGRPLIRLIVGGIAAFAAANYYFLLGFIRHIPLAQSFSIYNPVGQSALESATPAPPVSPGLQLHTNPLFQIALVGAVLGVAVGILLIRRERGKVMLALSGAILVMLMFYDQVTPRLGLFFRVRQGWISGELMAVAMGIGVGACVLLASRLMSVEDPLWSRMRDSMPKSFGLVQVAALVIVVFVMIGLSPRYQVAAAARVADPSGYPNADRVAASALDHQEKLTATLVGGPEQFQEAAYHGFFVEAWVFARDITYTEARDPSYQVPIPTNDVYVFGEKNPFGGPQAPPYGPAQEFYRDFTKRTRIEQRIIRWCDMYRRFHGDMDVFYEDDNLIVYHLKRKVDVRAADSSPEFKDYRWAPKAWFNSDRDVTTDRVLTNRRVKLPEK